MKTQPKFQIKSQLATLAITIMLAFTFNSCQKDDLSSMGSNSNQNGANESLSNMSAKQPSFGMALVKIDHMSAKSAQPSYSVTVYANGNVVFIGRANVQRIGRTVLLASGESMAAIKKMIANSNFLEITVKNENQMDLPSTITTCTIRQQPASDQINPYVTKSLEDFNNGYPRVLYTLRTNIEKQLPIQNLIGK